MRHARYLSIAASFIVVLFFAGCKESNSTEPVTTDQEAMKELISNDAFFATENIMNDGDPSDSQSFGLTKAAADIIPYFWGRKITSANRTVEFTVVTDSTALAVVTHTWTGIIWIRGKYDRTDTVFTVITKDVTESTTRYVKFVRVDRKRDPRQNWQISEISVLKGGTLLPDLSIKKVVFYLGADSVVIDDTVTTYFEVRHRDGPHRIRTCPPSFLDTFKVRVELMSADTVRDYVVAYRPVWVQNANMYRRGNLTLVSSEKIGDSYKRIYEHTWHGAWVGRHNIMIGAITHRSIFDTVAPFASQIWGIPYLVQQ